MSIYRLNSENANPRAPSTLVLSRHRHARLRHDAPRREFRDPLIEPGLDLVVETVSGCRPIALLAVELDR
jgi:hypothetical protein